MKLLEPWVRETVVFSCTLGFSVFAWCQGWADRHLWPVRCVRLFISELFGGGITWSLYKLWSFSHVGSLSLRLYHPPSCPVVQSPLFHCSSLRGCERKWNGRERRREREHPSGKRDKILSCGEPTQILFRYCSCTSFQLTLAKLPQGFVVRVYAKR